MQKIKSDLLNGLDLSWKGTRSTSPSGNLLSRCTSSKSNTLTEWKDQDKKGRQTVHFWENGRDESKKAEQRSPGEGKNGIYSPSPWQPADQCIQLSEYFLAIKIEKNNNKIRRKGERLMPIRMTFLTERERGRESKHTQTQPIGVITGGSVIAGAIAAFYLLFYSMETVCQKVRRGRKWIRERGEEKSSLSPKNEWKELEATRKVDGLAVTV